MCVFLVVYEYLLCVCFWLCMSMWCECVFGCNNHLLGKSFASQFPQYRQRAFLKLVVNLKLSIL